MSGTSRVAPMLFTAPDLDDRELGVLAEISALKKSLRFQLVEPRRWPGALRRMTFARNIQGSNTIEGFDAKLDDAAAVALGEPTLDADTETAMALTGYRSAMTYVLQFVQDPALVVTEQLIKSLHFMMTNYKMENRPGLWRSGSIFVQREQTGEIVHEGADIDQVPALMDALVESMNDRSGDPLLRAAMVHLNLVMIHPFRDGNGRMARCLQTLVLAADGTLSPVFSSIEEYLGQNAPSYYEVLGSVGGGSWQPERDARAWVRFSLTAHLRQAQTLQRRIRSSEQMWSDLEAIVQSRKVPERSIPLLFDAAYGFRVRRATYIAALKDGGEEISENTATRDFKVLVDAGLLDAHGDKRGRIYTAAEPLREVRARARAMQAPRDETDPFGGSE
ncbi:MAG: Fic family protein [Microbacterium sp.]